MVDAGTVDLECASTTNNAGRQKQVSFTNAHFLTTSRFMQKIPPKGLNLNTPISAELKHEFAKPSDSPDPDFYRAM